MVTFPVLVWRGGFASRVLLLGSVVGLTLGVLAWLDSGFWLSGVAVALIVGTAYGVWSAKRMAKYWPEGSALDGHERVAVVHATRRGMPIEDARLAGAAAAYGRGLHEAVAASRPLRWVIPLVLVVAIATAIFDAITGSVANVVVSVVYLIALVVEVVWLPKYQVRLLADVDRATMAGEQGTPPRR